MAIHRLVLFSVLQLFMLYSCTSEPKASKEELDLYQFKKVDLRPFDLDALIYIPDETAGIGASFKTSITHEEDFIWKISAGPNFELFIEDWGENADRFSKFKKQLLEDDIFKTTVIKETTKTLFYKRELKDPVLVDKYKHISYHVYALIPLHGFYYEIKNKPQGDPKETAEMMLTSLNSFKSFEP